MLPVIPADPLDPAYRLGTTLGPDRKHWFRAEFGGQYRLFFRCDSASRSIIYVWVNDPDTKRAYGSSSDAYAIFAKMLNADRPPDDWDSLLRETAELPFPLDP